MGITYGKKDKVFRQYGKPSLLLDFARRKKLLDTVSKKNPITFTRASSVATYVDADGLIKKAPVNLALYSEQFDNSYWPKDAVLIAANQIISPDGKQTADKMIATTTTANHLLNKTSTFAVVSGRTYTHSLYLKAAEYNFARLQFQSPGFTTSTWANFNLASGTVATTGGAQYVQAKIESVGNGWYRCSITATASSTTNTGLQPFVLDSDRGGTSPSFLGDGTSGVYIWGAQLEETDPETMAPTEYIKTTSTISGAPRFDHEPTSGNVTTNLLKYSEFQSSWNPGNVTKTLNAATDPFGGNNATEIEATASGLSQFSQAFSAAISGETYTFSVYAKANSSNFLRIGIYDSSVGWKNLSDINLSNGTTPDSATITAVGSGWYRIQITATLEAAGANMYFYITSDIAGSTATGGESVYIYGAQLEPSSTAGTYVRTLGETRSISDARAESKGLLIEEARTNIAPYGNNMSQFGSVNTTKTANNAVAPDGTSTATKLEYSGSSAVWFLDYSIATPATGSGTYTFSVYVKGPDDQPDDYYGCRIALLTTTGNNTEVSFGLTKEWKRISVTKTYTTESGNLRIHPIIFRNTPGNTDSGKVVPSYVWVWGAQWEQGSFPTSYIPTDGSTVQRTADITTVEGNDFKRTNLIGYSQDFNNTGWTYNQYLTPVANATIAPDGTQTAYLAIPNTNSAVHYFKNATFINLNASTRYTYTVYAKAGGYGSIRFHNLTTSAAPRSGRYNLIDGTVDQDNMYLPYGGFQRIESVGNGWYKCIFSFGTHPTYTAMHFEVLPLSASLGTYGSTYAGDGLSGVYLWGAQLERSDYPTDYIPTTTTSASAFPWANDTQGTMLSVYNKFAPNEQTNRNVWSLDYNGSNYVAVFSDYTWHSNLHNDVVISTGGNGYVTVTKPDAGTEIKNSFAYTPLTSSVAINGSVYQINNSALPPIGRLTIGARAGYFSPLNGHIKKMTYWNSALSGSALQLMTGDE